MSDGEFPEEKASAGKASEIRDTWAARYNILLCVVRTYCSDEELGSQTDPHSLPNEVRIAVKDMEMLLRTSLTADEIRETLQLESQMDITEEQRNQCATTMTLEDLKNIYLQVQNERKSKPHPVVPEGRTTASPPKGDFRDRFVGRGPKDGEILMT